MFLNVKIEKVVGGNSRQSFALSGVWHVAWWWNLITSVCLIQIGNNRNDHFRYLLGVCLITVSFKVNKGNKLGTLATVRLIEDAHLIRCPLNTGFTVFHT